MFWIHAAFPDNDNCPAVGRRGGQRTFVDSCRELSYTQFAILVHELAHLYDARAGGSEQAEVYSAQACVALDPLKSLQNAGNYALYAACECCNVLSKDSATFVIADPCAAVKAGCTRFPLPPVGAEL